MPSSDIPTPGSDGDRAWFRDGGEMGALMRSIDWSKTPVGPEDAWPQSLKTVLNILLTSQHPIFVWWGPELVQFYNDGYRPILGSTKHPAAMGQRGRECWREIWDVIEPMIETVFAGGSTYTRDGLLMLERHGYPEECYFDYAYSPLRDETGAVAGVFCAVTETTSKVIGARRLRTLRELAARTNETRNAGEVCRVAAEVLSANPHDVPFACLYLAGPDGPKPAGTAGIAAELPAEGLALGDRPAIIDDARACFGTLPGGVWEESPGTLIVLPLPLPGRVQPEGWLVAGVSPRRRLDADYRSFFDLTAQQVATALAAARAHEEEKRRADALAELDRAKTAFFSNVSHEFRTPLTLLLGPLDELLRDGHSGLTPQDRERLEVAHRSALRLLKLVNTLLEFSRIEAGRVEANYEPADLTQVTADIASVFRSAIEKAGLRYEIDCERMAEPVYVDRGMWEKVILNLLSNAIKFTFQGSIRVELRNRVNHVELSVTDTGTGIPADALPHIFERFYRVAGAQGRSFEGSGIGLALVQEFVKLHGGQVDAESRLGVGSTFRVRLPLGAAHLPEDRVGRGESARHSHADAYVTEVMEWLPAPGEAAARPAEARRRRPLGRVLVADDNADMREYVVHILEQDYEVTTVANGEEALASATASPPDLVVSDVMMPRMDGFALLRALRSRPNTMTVPVILLSARAGEDSRLEGLEAGADDYLVKPFSARELLARVTAQVTLQRHRRKTEVELQRLTDALPALVAYLGRDRCYQRVNRAYAEFFGVDAQGICGKHIEEFFGGGYYTLVRERLEQAFHGQYVTFETPAPLRADRYLAVAYTPEIDESGSVRGVIIHATDITDRKRFEQALLRSEEQLRTLADSIPQLAWIAEPDGWVSWYNQRWYEYTGAMPAQMEGWGWQQIHDPQELPGVLEAWRATLESGDPFEMVFPLRGANGQYRRFLTRMVPLKDARGGVIRWFGTNTDITAQLEAEQRIRDLNRDLERRVKEFETLLDVMPVGVAVAFDPECRHIRLNPAFAQMVGTDTSENASKTGPDASGLPFRVLRSGEEVAGTDLPMQVAAREGREIRDVELDLVRRDGRYITELGFAKPLFDEAGKVRGSIGVFLDITERKQVEMALRESEQRFRVLADSAPVFIWLANTAGKCTWFSRGWLDFTGRTIEQELGDGWGEGVHPDDLARCRETHAAASQAREPFKLEYRLRRHDGEWRWVLDHGVPLVDGAGRFAGHTGCCIDITDRRRAEEELRAYNAALQRANADLEHFAYAAAHDLQEPLRMVSAFSQMLSRKYTGKLDSFADEYISYCVQGARRMQLLIQDLLAYARASTLDQVSRQEVNASVVLERALANLETAIQETEAKITSDNLPSVVAEPIHLQQLFQNLIGNAIKYRNPGRRPVIHVSASRQRGLYMFSVKDNGIGIEREYAEHIFGLFKRLHAGDGFDGTGVGLAICRKLVERYGGQIWVESEPGVGSTFHFTLPEEPASAVTTSA